MGKWGDMLKRLHRLVRASSSFTKHLLKTRLRSNWRTAYWRELCNIRNDGTRPTWAVGIHLERGSRIRGTHNQLDCLGSCDIYLQTAFRKQHAQTNRSTSAQLSSNLTLGPSDHGQKGFSRLFLKVKPSEKVGKKECKWVRGSLIWNPRGSAGKLDTASQAKAGLEKDKKKKKTLQLPTW